MKNSQQKYKKIIGKNNKYTKLDTFHNIKQHKTGRKGAAQTFRNVKR